MPEETTLGGDSTSPTATLGPFPLTPSLTHTANQHLKLWHTHRHAFLSRPGSLRGADVRAVRPMLSTHQRTEVSLWR